MRAFRWLFSTMWILFLQLEHSTYLSIFFFPFCQSNREGASPMSSKKVNFDCVELLSPLCMAKWTNMQKNKVEFNATMQQGLFSSKPSKPTKYTYCTKPLSLLLLVLIIVTFWRESLITPIVWTPIIKFLFDTCGFFCYIKLCLNDYKILI